MRVRFPLVKQVGTNLIEYPDSSELFSNVESSDDGLELYADYSGDLTLDDYADPASFIISAKEVWRRFTPTERRTLANHTHARAIAFISNLQIEGEADLLDPDFVEDINAMEAATIIAEGRAVEILTMEA